MMKTILLTEDDPFIVDIYTIQLRQEGYKVDIAKDGQIALEKIKNNCPDLLVLDINLPKINGCQLLKIIRDDPKTKNLKVIVFSNLNQEDFPDDISNLGVIKYFLKIESNPEDITNYIKEILN